MPLCRFPYLVAVSFAQAVKSTVVPLRVKPLHAVSGIFRKVAARCTGLSSAVPVSLFGWPETAVSANSAPLTVNSMSKVVADWPSELYPYVLLRLPLLLYRLYRGKLTLLILASSPPKDSAAIRRAL